MTLAPARVAGLLLFLALLQACSSTPSGEQTGSSALQQLRKGACPVSIVGLDGRNAEGEFRYGRKLSSAEIAALRQQEQANCNTAVARGDTGAMRTLVGFYRASGRKAELVKTLETYVAKGSDREAMSQAGTYLYRAYTSGNEGVQRDADRAFNYLGVAVNNGARELELPYASQLLQRGLEDDALRYLLALNARSDLGREDRCETELSLAQLYFGAGKRHENWNLGYYYWQSGLQLARSPRWGSCAQDNFTNGDRYSYESRRKKFVDSRIAMMSSAQRQVIDEARADPRRGLGFVAALSFSRPANAPAAPAAAAPSPTAPSSALLAAGTGLPAWRRVDAGICSLRGTGYSQPWSDVFERNSGAIWTLDSRNGATEAQGSAVAVSRRALITNCHLIEHPRNITLLRVGQRLPATLVAADTRGDRCVLAVDRDLPAWVQMARSESTLKVGEDVAAIGNPRGLETSLSRGIVAQKRARDGLQLIQTDAAISPGSSGGGLFDHAGNLVGITTFSVSSGQSLNFAIAIDEFCR